MQLEPGMLVRSKAGHDKDRIYVVIRAEDEYVYVADGDLRPLRHVKRKNVRHLQPVLKMRLEGEPDDAAVRSLIRKYIRQGETGLGTGAGRL
ncbi:MAG TPA: KOW domain-containing RNA-binding protein [Candidatus Mediterraneibacter faecavium]|uniref:KOW domain-containing RNA-binding protein n=1 Tax=Candidatus Mediterraneibacter faecavium TaxID=2838668 RepID=A0A9D2QC40_9FIRM|nr:KOW domain-containing RNA-binding protein [Candidatus Mediterraneibacter faecavium]